MSGNNSSGAGAEGTAGGAVASSGSGGQAATANNASTGASTSTSRSGAATTGNTDANPPGPSGSTTRGSRSNSTSGNSASGGGEGPRRTRRNRWTNEEEEVSDDGGDIPIEFRDFLMDQIARQIMMEQFGPDGPPGGRGGGGGPPFPFPFGPPLFGPPPFGPPYYDDETEDEEDYDDDDDDSMPPLESRDGRIQRDSDGDDDSYGSMPSLEDIVGTSSRAPAPRDLSEVESDEDDDDDDGSLDSMPPLSGDEESDGSMPTLEPISSSSHGGRSRRRNIFRAEDVDDFDDSDDDEELRLAIQMSLRLQEQMAAAAAADGSDDDDEDDSGDSLPALEAIGDAGSRKATSVDNDTNEDMPPLEPLHANTARSPTGTAVITDGHHGKGVRRQREAIGRSNVRSPSTSPIAPGQPNAGESRRKKRNEKKPSNGTAAAAGAPVSNGTFASAKPAESKPKSLHTGGLWLMAKSRSNSAGEETSAGNKSLWHIGANGSASQVGCVSASAKLIPDVKGGALIHSPQDSASASRWSLEKISPRHRTPSKFQIINSESQLGVDYKGGVWALAPSKDGEVMVLSSLRRPQSRSSGRSTIRTFPASSTLIGCDSKGVFIHVPRTDSHSSLHDVGIWRVVSKTESKRVVPSPEDADQCLVDGTGEVYCLALGNKKKQRKLCCLSEIVDPLFFVRQPLLICAAENGGVFLHCPGEGKFSSWSLKHIARDGSTLKCTDLGECPRSARIISGGGNGVWIVKKSRTKGANPSLSYADPFNGGSIEVICEELPFMPDGMDVATSK